MLHHVRESFFHTAEEEQTTDQQHNHRNRGEQEGHIGRGAAKKRPAEALHHPDHRVEAVNVADGAFGNDRDRVNDRGGIHPDLKQKRHHLLNVTILHIQRREPQAYSQGCQNAQERERDQPQGGPGQRHLKNCHGSKQQDQ